MNTVLCSVVSNDFVPGFLCQYKSLLEHNPGWQFPVKLFWHPEICPLAEKARDLIMSYCQNVSFHEVNLDDYRIFLKLAREVLSTPKRLLAGFLILEAFRLPGIEQAICLDSDLLILGPLDELLVERDRFAVVRAYNPKTNLPIACVNTGLMSIGRWYRNRQFFESMPEILAHRHRLPGTGRADQAIINMLFQNAQIHYLPRKLNYTKRMLLADSALDSRSLEEQLSDRDIRVLHFIAGKPWQEQLAPAEVAFHDIHDLWHRAFLRLLGVSLQEWRRQNPGIA